MWELILIMIAASLACVSSKPELDLTVAKGFKRYVHDVDCSAYNSWLRLRYFSVLYPEEYVAKDCRECPDSYVQFSRFCKERHDYVTANISISYNTMLPILYNIMGDSFLDTLITQIRIKLQANPAEVVNSEPIKYRGGGTFYRRDYVMEHAKGKSYGRFVAIPNFENDNGILISFYMVTDTIPEAVFQEFDTGEFNTVFESLIASLEFDFIGANISGQIDEKDLPKLKQDETLSKSFEDKVTVDIEGVSISSYTAHIFEVIEFLKGIKNDLVAEVSSEHPSYEEAYFDSIINVKLSFDEPGESVALVYGLYFEGTIKEPPNVPEDVSLMLDLCKKLMLERKINYIGKLEKIIFVP